MKIFSRKYLATILYVILLCYVPVTVLGNNDEQLVNDALNSYCQALLESERIHKEYKASNLFKRCETQQFNPNEKILPMALSDFQKDYENLREEISGSSDEKARISDAELVKLSLSRNPFRSILDDGRGFRVIEPGAEKLETEERELEAGKYYEENVVTQDFDNPIYLENADQTEETQVLLNLASNLDFSIKEIINWANNVEIVTTYASTQSASHTASSNKGTSIDVAALVVSLARISDIPARFVMGRVRVSSTVFNAWLGVSFENIDVATDFLAASGRNVAVVTNNGEIVAVEFDHNWVEVAVDYYPSRGEVNTMPDQWISIDPSFALFEQISEPDYAEIANFDIAELRDNYVDSLEINSDENWIRGGDLESFSDSLTLSDGSVNTVINEYESHYQSSIRDRNSISVRELVGGPLRKQDRTKTLPSSLPYRVILVTHRSEAIPENFNIVLKLGFGRSLFGELIESISVPIYEMNAKNILISSVFSDQDSLDSYEAVFTDDGVTIPTILSLSQLGSVVPEIRVLNGGASNTLLRGNPAAIGELVDFGYSIRKPNESFSAVKFSRIPNGSLLSFGVASTSVPPEAVRSVQDQLLEFKGALEQSNSGEDLAAFASNFSNRMYSNIFQGIMLDYFGRPAVIGDLLTKSSGSGAAEFVVGVGIAGHIPQVNYFLGLIPTTLSKGTLQVDVGILEYNILAADGSQETTVDLARKIGAFSSELEGSIPNQLLDPALIPTDDPGYAASSNLARALELDQRVFTLQPGDQVPSSIQVPVEVREDIENALATGKEITVHDEPLVVQGQTEGLNSTGYVVFDGQTGAAQYLLDAGTDGGLSAEHANDIMATCAYINRPEFIDNNNDWERQLIIQQCAAFVDAFSINFIDQLLIIFDRIDLINKFNQMYAQIPMVQADCIVAGAPELAQILILIRQSAIQFAIIVSNPSFVIGLTEIDMLADEMQELIDRIVMVCGELN